MTVSSLKFSLNLRFFNSKFCSYSFECFSSKTFGSKTPSCETYISSLIWPLRLKILALRAGNLFKNILRFFLNLGLLLAVFSVKFIPNLSAFLRLSLAKFLQNLKNLYTQISGFATLLNLATKILRCSISFLITGASFSRTYTLWFSARYLPSRFSKSSRKRAFSFCKFTI